MIDASKGFMKDGNKNRLRSPGHPQDRRRLQHADRDRPLLAHGAAGRDRDPKNDFNLNIPRYIDCTEPEDLQDIDAHLHGGIPDRDIDALDRYWEVFPAVRAAAVQDGGPPGLQPAPKSPAAEIKTAIFGHAEFTAFNASVTELFAKWQTANTPRLKGIAVGDQAQGADRNAVRGPAGDLPTRRRCSTPTTSTST